MPKWFRYLCLLAVIAGSFVWIRPAVRCIVTEQQRVEREDAARCTLPRDFVEAKLTRIERRTGVMNEMTPDRYFKEMYQLRYLRDHVEQYADGTRRRADVIVRCMFQRAENIYPPDVMAAASLKFRHLEKDEPMPWGVMGRGLCHLYLWYFCFAPMLLVILFLKVTKDGQSIAWGIAAMRGRPIDLVLATILGVVFVKGYEVDEPLAERVRRLADAMDRLRIRSRPKTDLGWMKERAAIVRFDRPVLQSPFQSIVVLFQYIWGRPSLSWFRLIPNIWRPICTEAIFVTLVAMATMLVGNVRLAFAEESGQKEAKQPILTGVMWVRLDPNGLTPPTDSILLFHRWGELDFFGVNSNNPVLEASYLEPVRTKGLSLQVGPVIDYALGQGKVVGYGLYSLIFGKVGDGRFGGPLYLTSSPGDGKWTFFSPRANVLWPIHGSSQWSVGLGGILSSTIGGQTSFLAGPALQYKPTPHDTIYVRYGGWLTGKKGRIFRVDFSHFFK